MPDRVYFPLRTLIPGNWPLGSLIPEGIQNLWVTPPTRTPNGNLSAGIIVDVELNFQIPGLDSVTLALAPTVGGAELTLTISPHPFELRIEQAQLVLRIDADVLRPIKVGTTDQPDSAATTLEIALGTANLGLDGNGEMSLELIGGVSVPKCMVGATGVILGIGSLRWLSPSGADLPSNTPTGFTGLYLDNVTIDMTGLLDGLGDVRMDDVFLGTDGLSGTVAWTDTTFAWDSQNNAFSGALAKEIFGFKGGIASIGISLRQNALTACEITSDVFVPYLDKRMGLTLGLDGAGGLTAAAGLPHSLPPESGVTAGGPGYLLHVDVGDPADPFLKLDVDAVTFSRPAGGKAMIDISGAADIKVPGLDAPPFAFKGLRIDTDGKVAIDGGWIDLSEAKLAPFHGFPLEISRIGFGTEDSGCHWIGLNGGIKMADGLPLGASVEGLRICWDPSLLASLRVTLEGIGIEVRIPNTLEFAGAVSFFTDANNNRGFRGHVTLTLVSLKLTVDAQMVVGRTSAGDTFFFLYLAVDLPTGIPLFSTGAAIYGFAGLVATNMGPDRRNGEHWYYGWYLRDPKGVTSERKWSVQPGAFAGGVGTTIGTATDDGFAFSAKVLLILVLPGPQFLLQGKGSFLKARPGSQDVQQQGALEMLVVLDFPGKLFQANLAAAYSVQKFLTIEGGADVAFSWAPSPPPGVWHVYLGEKAPPERRIRARLFDILTANSYFQLTRSQIELGSWLGMAEKYRWGPVRAWFEASISGDALVSWNPQSFVGSLQLVGSAGISAFGVKVRVSLNSSVTAMGPKPWYLSMVIELSIEVDLWFVEFSKTVTLPLTWGSPNTEPPDPASPVVFRLAAEHLMVDEATELSNGQIPPDGRPVVIFQRPVFDRAGIGSPGAPPPSADNVGVRTFSYQLVHVALIRRDGGDRVISAAGVLDVSGNTVRLLGDPPGRLTLPSAAGSTLEVGGGGTFPVTGSGAGTLSVTGSVPAGQHAYRLQGRQARADVQVGSVTAGAYSTALLLLSADHGRGVNAFAGGRLEQGANHWTIISDDGTKVMVRTPDSSPTPDPATLLAASGGLLEGQWLPVDDRESAGDAAPTTKLMLWARTPFVWFRRNDPEAALGFAAHNPSYACGPTPVEQLTCLGFDDLPPGRLSKAFQTGSTRGVVAGNVRVLTSAANLSDRFLGLRAASITLTFDPPVDAVVVRYRAGPNTSASGVVRRRGSVVAGRNLPPNKTEVEFAGEIDELLITSRGVLLLDAVCIRPDWICVTFEKASIDRGSTGSHTVGTIVIETAGTMEVKDDTLIVRAPARGVGSVARAATVDGRVLTRTRLLPAARATEVWARVGPQTEGTLIEVPRVLITGVRGEVPTYLPGLGAVLAIPFPDPRPVPGPGPGGRRPGVPRPPDVPRPDRRWPPVPSLPLDAVRRLVVGTNGTRSALASVAFLFPQPVTRVRVRLNSRAEVVAYAGTREVARSTGAAGEEVLLSTPTGFIDRVVGYAPEVVQVTRVCYDTGDLGWQRLAQEQWQETLQQSIEWLYREDPVLPPGDYRLEVVTAVQTGGAGPGTSWSNATANFTVGPPPGLGTPTGNSDQDKRYPHGGPLNDLGTYVESSIPALGQRPFYRAYDVGVAFNVPYVSRMFLAAGKELTIAVVDSNDRDRRSGSRFFWGEGETLALAREEEDWVTTLGADPTTQCPTVDVDRVAARTEEVSVGAGELLAPAELHAGELRATGSTSDLFRFEFVTSRFADFVHHMATFDGRCRPITGARSGAFDPAKVSAIATVGVELGHAYSNYVNTRALATTGSPTREQLDAFAAARVAIRQALEAWRKARVDAFNDVWNAYFDGPPDVTLPRGVEVARVLPASGSTAPAVLLIESPEPIPWDRTIPFLTRSDAVPLRLRNLPIIRATFGAPDAGTTFGYADLTWTTDVELRVVEWHAGEEGVQPRVPGPWTLTIDTPGARAIDVVLLVAAGGSAQLHGEGLGVGPDLAQGPTAPESPAALRIEGQEVHRVRLTGTGTTLVRLVVVEQFRPVPPFGDVRLLRAVLPTAPGDDHHYVEITTSSDIDLSGWAIRWFGALAPQGPDQYHKFVALGSTLRDSQIARVYGGLATPPTVSGVTGYAGGAIGTLPTSGCVFQLVDPAGRVAHEIAVLPPPASDFAGAWAIARLAVNDDSTRALILPFFGSIDPGHWQLRLGMMRRGWPETQILSVGGDTSPEQFVLGFTTE